AGRPSLSAGTYPIRCVAICQVSDRHDPVTLDADVSAARFRAGSVNHHSAGYHDVEFWSGGTGSNAARRGDDHHEKGEGSPHDLVFGRIRGFHEGSVRDHVRGNENAVAYFASTLHSDFLDTRQIACIYRGR